MFWRMTGLTTASPVETILDKENFTLEELLDEDEIIQECKALNSRLINFLRERSQVKQLVCYIVEEAPEDAEKGRTFKFPFIASEIFTCDVDIILKTLVEDEELMNLLFSFLEPDHSHSTLLSGYFSKVVVTLLVRKTVPFMSYIQAHQEIIKKLVELIGITSIMEVLIRLIGADEHLYSSYVDSMQWLEDTDVLELIVDKFSSSDSPEVHANAAEALCAITRYAPAGLTAKISSPSFIGRLFSHALGDSRPSSVLVHSLSVCISLLDPKRLPSGGTYYMYNRQLTHASLVTPNPKTVEGMLESLGNLLKLLNVSSEENVLPTTYGKLQPPLGKHRLKIIEFISVLMTVSNEAAERELIRLGALKRIIELFFEYPYNNFIHHHIEQIIVSCLESKNTCLVEHVLQECNLVGKILNAEKNCCLTCDLKTPTIPADGRSPPRIGNIGYMTRIANKLMHLGNSNSELQAYLQDNGEWADWHTNVLSKRNTLENVYQWACGRPTTLHDRGRDSDDDDYQDKDYDVTALANNLSQAFRYGIYGHDEIDEAHGSLERDDEDVYFDDESAELVISSLRLGDDQESGSLFTNSNWFASEDERVINEPSTESVASPSPNTEEGTGLISGVEKDEVLVSKTNAKEDTATSELPEPKPNSDNLRDAGGSREVDKPAEWVEWRDSVEESETIEASAESSSAPVLPNGELEVESVARADEVEASHLSTGTKEKGISDVGGSLGPTNVDSTSKSPHSLESAKVEASHLSTGTEEKGISDDGGSLGPTNGDSTSKSPHSLESAKVEASYLSTGTEEKGISDDGGSLGPTNGDSTSKSPHSLESAKVEASHLSTGTEEKGISDDGGSLGPTNGDSTSKSPHSLELAKGNENTDTHDTSPNSSGHDEKN